MSQACDLANAKATKVQIAVLHEAAWLVEEGVLKPQTIKDQVRRHRVFGWYFLPAGESVPESLADLRNACTVPRDLVEAQIENGHRKAAIASPYREHLAQQFALTYMRIALPEPYETEDEGE